MMKERQLSVHLYSHCHAMLLQGQSIENREPTAAERAAKEFTSVEGIGEATAMVLASTCALGGAPHASLTSLTEWASQQDNWRCLQEFLLHRCVILGFCDVLRL